MQDIKVWGIYRHYKWNSYKVIWLWKHSETLEDFVIYEALYENSISKIWCRPLSNFTEQIVIKNTKIKRFQFVK